MIELLCLDIDGTMTNGDLCYSLENGEVVENLKKFNVKDGLGLNYWKKIGKKSAIITKRENKTREILEFRAKEVGIDFVFMGISDKAQKVRELAKTLNLSKENIACIGDDMNDISMFRQSGLTFAPFDAASYIRQIAQVRLIKKGGEGAVREAIEYILMRENLYEAFIQAW